MLRNLGAWLVAVGCVLGVAFTTLVGVADATRNSSGTHSLPAGNPVVSGTSITSSWANNTLSDISSEITNSLDRGGRGAMTAPLPLATGSCAAPSLTFSADTDVGLYRAGANDTRLCIASSPIQHWTTTGAVFPIGLTATASGALDGVRGTATTTAGSCGLKGIATTRTGVKGEATSGDAVYGAATDGRGGYFTSSTGVGVYATSVSDDGIQATGFERGIYASGGAYGVYAEGTSGGNALAVGTGHAVFLSSNPSSSTSYSNTLTPINFAKAWGVISTNGAGAASVVDGFNVTSAAAAGTVLTITLASTQANTTFSVLITDDAGGSYNVYRTPSVNKTTTTIRVEAFDVNAAAAVNFQTSSQRFQFVVFARQ